MFRVGQKVVCVDASPGRHTFIRYLKRGAIYTIRGIDTESGQYGVWLQEVILPVIAPWKLEMSFMPTRFRPIVEKSTDTGMAVLREILDRESFDEKTPEHHRA